MAEGERERAELSDAARTSQMTETLTGTVGAVSTLWLRADALSQGEQELRRIAFEESLKPERGGPAPSPLVRLLGRLLR